MTVVFNLHNLGPETKIIILSFSIVIVLAIHWLIQVIISNKLRKSKRIPLDIINTIKILITISTAFLILYLIMIFYNLPAEGIIGVSAFLGAIISFGSTQTLRNFIAGIYIVFTQPFGVNDFIALSNEVRGEVVEISLNYTKVRTVDNIYHYIPNKNFMDTDTILYKQKIERRIGTTEAKDLHPKKSRFRKVRTFALQLIEEEVVRYTFIWGAPLGDLKSSKEKIQEVCDIYAGIFGYRPSFFLYNLDYRMQFKIIIKTHSTELLIKHVRRFRDDLVAQFHD